MAYHLEHTQLRVVRKYTCQQRNRVALKDARLIVLEHILPTTEGFLLHLRESGAEIFGLIGKPYSIDESVVVRLEREGLTVNRKTYQELEDTDFLKLMLVSAVDKSKKDKKQIVVIDVGGYFARPLAQLSPDDAQFIAG